MKAFPEKLSFYMAHNIQQLYTLEYTGIIGIKSNEKLSSSTTLKSKIKTSISKLPLNFH